MQHPNVSRFLRDELELDDGTVTALVSGQIGPDDAPPAYRAVAELLTSAHEPVALDAVDEVEAGLAMAAEISMSRPPTRRSTPMAKFRTAKIATIAAGVVISLSGAAAATSGILPGSFDNTITTVPAEPTTTVADETTTTVPDDTTTTVPADTTTTVPDGTTTTVVDTTTTTVVSQPTTPVATGPLHPGAASCHEAKSQPGAHGCSAVAKAFAPGQVKKVTKAQAPASASASTPHTDKGAEHSKGHGKR